MELVLLMVLMILILNTCSQFVLVVVKPKVLVGVFKDLVIQVLVTQFVTQLLRTFLRHLKGSLDPLKECMIFKIVLEIWMNASVARLACKII